MSTEGTGVENKGKSHPQGRVAFVSRSVASITRSLDVAAEEPRKSSKTSVCHE